MPADIRVIGFEIDYFMFRRIELEDLVSDSSLLAQIIIQQLNKHCLTNVVQLF